MTAAVARAVIGTVPGRRPLVGHALAMTRDAYAVMDSARVCGDIAVLWLGPKPAYVISHPGLIRQLLTDEDSRLDKGPLYENLAQLIGVSIGTMIGREHRARRRLVSPAYQPNPSVMADCAAELVESWEPGRRYDMVGQMRRYSFMVMARTLFTDAVSRADEAEFVELLPVALAGIARYMADPTGLLKRLPTRANRQVNDALGRLKRITENAVDAYRAGHGGAGGIVAALVDARDPKTGRPLRTEEIRNEAMVLMSAGSETVAGVLSNACALLAHDPELAARLRAEADQGAELDLTRRVVSEILRLWPPGALMSRRAVVDLDLGGHRIPAGAALFFCPYLLHRRPELYPEPDRFDPDRWLPGASRPLGAFMPFGAGPHICVGETIAWQEALIAVSTMARTCTFSPASDHTPRPVLAPTLGLDSVPVTVHRRTS
ncbi:cytochrome P450 [Pseudonocardia spinosispora]|uniref:cytochrome P450 n=1 Tax=Pseudonocardia spinosispora TaxID=103441 RepID=UPI000429286E|nr:cytochrome P450 [Pseudonocardia spinosispora]